MTKQTLTWRENNFGAQSVCKFLLYRAVRAPIRAPIGARALRLQPHQPHGWSSPDNTAFFFDLKVQSWCTRHKTICTAVLYSQFPYCLVQRAVGGERQCPPLAQWSPPVLHVGRCMWCHCCWATICCLYKTYPLHVNNVVFNCTTTAFLRYRRYY